MRSIPACAGKPPSRYSLSDEPLDAGSIPACAGKPGAGVPLSILISGLRNGSIPACAGKPIPASCAGDGPPDQRSIPACAGKPTGSGSCRYASEMARVYPRVCGETRLRRPTYNTFVQEHGSIPACAGKPTGPAALPVIDGLDGSIPACAGKPRCFRQ